MAASDKAFSYISDCVDTMAALSDGDYPALDKMSKLREMLNDLSETLDEVELDEEDEGTEEFINACEDLAYEMGNRLGEELEQAVYGVIGRYEESAKMLLQNVKTVSR